jgi:hypothetical protein
MPAPKDANAPYSDLIKYTVWEVEKMEGNLGLLAVHLVSGMPKLS